jgi:hypothetical protein
MADSLELTMPRRRESLLRGPSATVAESCMAGTSNIIPQIILHMTVELVS